MNFTRTNTGDRKAAIITGPDELLIEVDTDDVGPEIEDAIEKLLDTLNRYYPYGESSWDPC